MCCNGLFPTVWIFSHWVVLTEVFFHAGVWAHPTKLICVFWPSLCVVGCVQLVSGYEYVFYVAVCVFAGVHNEAKPIQCHWRVKGGCKGSVGECCGQCMGGRTNDNI